MNHPEQSIDSLPPQTQLVGHLYWHGSNSLLLAGADQPQQQCAVGKLSCRYNRYGTANCCPVPVSGGWFDVGRMPWLNVRVSLLNDHLCTLSASSALSHSMVTADGGLNEFTF